MKKNELNNVRIGDEIPSLTLKPISRSMLALYASASGDHNPIHIDIDFAKKNGLSDIIAHGMLVMSFLAQAITNIFPQNSIKKFDAKFIAVTNINDILTCEGKIIDIEFKDSLKRLFLKLLVIDESGEKKLSGSATIELIINEK
jgi:acyl dehydratase|tara:strand:- start:3380 stop:3811 length:432 start_codon:yes stop_codon:yes gene_type:complete